MAKRQRTMKTTAKNRRNEKIKKKKGHHHAVLFSDMDYDVCGLLMSFFHSPPSQSGVNSCLKPCAMPVHKSVYRIYYLYICM